MAPELVTAISSVLVALISAAVALYLGRDRARLRRELAHRDRTPSGTFPAAGRPRILVVDDERTIPALMARAITRAGIRAEIHTSGSVAGAVALARETRFAVALLDVHLPDGDVAEVVAALRTPPALLFFSGDPGAAEQAAQDHDGAAVDKFDLGAILAALRARLPDP